MNDDLDSNHSSNGGSAKNAGGVFIAIGGTIGVMVGGVMGQPSAGLLGGLLLGGLIALAIWLFDR